MAEIWDIDAVFFANYNAQWLQLVLVGDTIGC